MFIIPKEYMLTEQELAELITSIEGAIYDEPDELSFEWQPVAIKLRHQLKITYGVDFDSTYDTES